MTDREIVSWIIHKFEGLTFVHRSAADDPGGATKYGVTLKAYQDLHPEATVDTFRNLTLDEAIDFMIETHVEDPGLHKVESSELRVALIDFSIHSGPGRAVKYLQKVIGASSDGVLGPVTRGLLAAENPVQIANLVTGRRLKYLAGLRNWDANSEGWARRVSFLVDQINRLP